MDAGKLVPKKRKKCSKRSRSSSSRSEDEVSRKKDHFQKSKQSSKTKLRAKKCSDVEEDGTSRELTRKIERKKQGKKSKLKERKLESEKSSSFSLSESEKWKKKKRKDKKKKKKKKIKEKEKAGKRNYLNSISQINLGESTSNEGQEEMNIQSGPAAPVNSTKEPKRRAMAPMTKEEYDKQQSIVRRVFDPDTGRERLIKGEGEIVEEVVCYERHKAINKLSTAGDGATFQKSLGLNR